MKLLKAAARACVAITLIASIAGCVIVPVPFGQDYHHHYYRR
ncbi:MAG: hypothetical protein JWQ11_3835 [Rhizobacter sp.]|nr:hypothetical protein [Rhizobacter sp.]